MQIKEDSCGTVGAWGALDAQRIAMDKYGVRAQLGVTQEKCAKLIVAISKLIRNVDSKIMREPTKVSARKYTASVAKRHDIIEAIADVYIMVEAITDEFGIEKQVESAYLNRLEKLRGMVDQDGELVDE